MSNGELEFIMDAIESMALNIHEWMTDYEYEPSTNEFHSSVQEYSPGR
jgi:hypothetical protein